MGNRSGKVIAACASESGGVPKQPLDRVTLTAQGVEGDWHAGRTRTSKSKGRVVPNDRQISVVAKEVLDSVGETLQIEVGPGGFAENFLVGGIGDLADLEAGDLIRLGSDAVIEVSAQNPPCSKINVHHPDIARLVAGRRGIVGVVRKPGDVRPGDAVIVEKASQASRGEAASEAGNQ
ncbi:MAG: MOSC domain-containing protein [Chloroflexota bacterium]